MPVTPKEFITKIQAINGEIEQQVFVMVRIFLQL